MSDERFERELRSALAAMAPSSVPASLIVSVEDVTQRRPGRIRSRMPRALSFAGGLLGIIAIVAATATIVVLRGTAGPASTSAAPAAASTIVGSFVWQVDGKYGYAMWRPADWSVTDLDVGRGYIAPGAAPGQLPMSITSVNYLTLSPIPNEILTERTLFEEHPSLDGWATAMEQLWRSNRFDSALLRVLPDARIYGVTMPESSDLSLVALVVDGAEPIGVTLHASGPDADSTHLEQTGVFADFVTIVESVRSVPHEPENVVPALPSSGVSVQVS